MDLEGSHPDRGLRPGLQGAPDGQRGLPGPLGAPGRIQVRACPADTRLPRPDLSALLGRTGLGNALGQRGSDNLQPKAENHQAAFMPITHVLGPRSSALPPPRGAEHQRSAPSPDPGDRGRRLRQGSRGQVRNAVPGRTSEREGRRRRPRLLRFPSFPPPSCPQGPRPGRCSAVRVAWRLSLLLDQPPHTSSLRLRPQQAVGGAEGEVLSAQHPITKPPAPPLCAGARGQHASPEQRRSPGSNST